MYLPLKFTVNSIYEADCDAELTFQYQINHGKEFNMEFSLPQAFAECVEMMSDYSKHIFGSKSAFD